MQKNFAQTDYAATARQAAAEGAVLLRYHGTRCRWKRDAAWRFSGGISCITTDAASVQAAWSTAPMSSAFWMR